MTATEHSKIRAAYNEEFADKGSESDRTFAAFIKGWRCAEENIRIAFGFTNPTGPVKEWHEELGVNHGVIDLQSDTTHTHPLAFEGEPVTHTHPAADCSHSAFALNADPVRPLL